MSALAAPQALIESEGWRRDVAARNRTIAELAHRLKAVETLHKGVSVGTTKICTECFDRWPCSSVRLARGQP